MWIWSQQKLVFSDGSSIYINIINVVERSDGTFGVARPFNKDVEVKYIPSGEYWMII